MIFPQMLLGLHDELLVDLFAGGGGASCGIEMATGRTVDIAINHDPAAVAMHRMNHPQTEHRTADVFEVDPREVTQGRPVGLLWASPDCTYHSKARGAKPIRHKNRKRRALAWVITRWAAQVRPRVITGENVEEFVDWGPLVAKRDPKTGRVLKADNTVAEPGERVPVEEQQLVPCSRRSGRTYRAFIRQLEALGYEVEWRERRACDSGAPTIRKRWYFIARCDGRPIVWPTPTHGTGKGLKPYRTAAECIDWSVPMLSIFATPEEAKEWARAHRAAGRKVGTPVRPLAEATLRRIARGVMRYVVESPEPYIVGVGRRAGQSPERSLRNPYQTITSKGDAALVVPSLVQTGYGERKGQAPRTLDIHEPLGTIVGGAAKHALVGAFLAKHFTGVVGSDLREPKGTVTTIDHDALVAAHLSSYHAAKHDGEARGAKMGAPIPTIDTSNRRSVVAAFLQSYYGTDQDGAVSDPLATITTKDRHSLVTVEVAGEPYVLADIAMRMLQPRELYLCQGFTASYIIDRGIDEHGQVVRLTKTEQVRMVGNSVSPEEAAALVRANVPELITRDEAKVA